MFNKRHYSLLLGALLMALSAHAQPEWSIKPGAYYNGSINSVSVNGGGLVVGLEYMPAERNIFSIDLRTKYGNYTFNDGTKSLTNTTLDPFNPHITYPPSEPGPPANKNEARVDYDVYSPQISLVPKLHIYPNKSLTLYLENEFAIGLITGKFKYMGFDKKEKFTEPIYSYNVGIGAAFHMFTLSLGYSTLNLSDIINKHKPSAYTVDIPNQNASFYFNLTFRFSLKNK